MIDTELPGHPHFQPNVLDIGDEQLEFYSRDVLKCIQSLYGDPSWAQKMVFAPEQHYTSHVHTSCIYNELYTVAQKTVPMFCYFGKTDLA